MTERLALPLPEGCSSLLLHSCCAPCSGDIIEALRESGVSLCVLFYNPNIHPRDEYERRKDENKRFAERCGVPFVDADYDPDIWFARVKGLEMEPERGARCTVCFDLRLERAALYAQEHGFLFFSSSLGISRWKNMEQVNACGHRAAARHEGLVYWDFNWRKGGGVQRMIEVAKREDFYRQDYCGCVFSLRDSRARKAERHG